MAFASANQAAIYAGSVRHRRFFPRSHGFNYPFYMFYFDLDGVESAAGRLGLLKRWPGLARWRRKDYWGEANIPLKQAIADEVQRHTGDKVTGRITQLCNLRYAGLYFSPVNFYYCFDQQEKLTHVVTEVSNTPWNERHCYVLPVTGESADSWCDKAFQVSPFNPLEQQYRMVLPAPGKQLRVHIENHQDNRCLFDATLALRHHVADRANVRRFLRKIPLMALYIVVGIYWQALKLFLKRVPFIGYAKPRGQQNNEV